MAGVILFCSLYTQHLAPCLAHKNIQLVFVEWTNEGCPTKFSFISSITWNPSWWWHLSQWEAKQTYTGFPWGGLGGKGSHRLAFLVPGSNFWHKHIPFINWEFWISLGIFERIISLAENNKESPGDHFFLLNSHSIFLTTRQSLHWC